MVGWGIAKLAALALPEGQGEETVKAVAAEATRIYCAQPVIASRPYTGMAELVTGLRAKKLKTAVLSNKPDPVLRLVIDRLFPAGAFDEVRGEQPGAARKPDPSLVWDLLVNLDRDPRNTLFVGDSEVDMETARNAGCYPLGVSWGFRSRAALEEAGAARIIDSPEEIWELVGRR
jgi:phosphoglycolate phosphatase